MTSGPQQGYRAVFSGLRTRSSQADASLDVLIEIRNYLSDTFYREGNPLGRDQYGEELAKNRFKVEDAVFGAFDTHLDELEYLRDGLRDNARNYEDAEGYGETGDLSSPDAPSFGDLPSYSEGW
ncbi:hypothetical protein AB0K40_37000 [Nonomuraea bangladeshensis]|uniref:Uncharacterized protein n=1 Tax=Nonomuraea bangladeshensis TaxID=404385 RepID=A0ABV3HF87_9ACTN